MFTTLLRIYSSENDYMPYLNQWFLYQDLAYYKEEEEYNLKANKKWKLYDKLNPRKLWNVKTSENEQTDPGIISTYFTNIFQSDNTKKNPTISNIVSILSDYNMYVPILYDAIGIHEVNDAINEIGTGNMLDGLKPDVTTWFTYEIKSLFVKLLNKVHGDKYLDIWKNQLLFSITKKGHTKNTLKL